TDGTVVRNNRVVRAVKYGIAAEFGAQDFHFHDNVVESAVGSGIACHDCNTGVIEHNVVSSMHYPTGRNATWPNGFNGELSQGITCVGAVPDLSTLQNVMASGDGTGIRVICSGPKILVQDNAIYQNCLKYGESLQIANASGVQVLGNPIIDPPQGC